MNTRIWFVIGWVMMMINLTSASSSSSASSSLSASWFRMKYLVGLYESYYDYRIHQFQLADNDRDTCTDVYKTATVYAITGRYLHKVKTTCSSFYTVKQSETETPPPPPPLPLIELHITPRDFLIRIFQLAHSTIKYGMLFLTISSYLLILILVYCQF